MHDRRPAPPRRRTRMPLALLAATGCLGCATLGEQQQAPLVPSRPGAVTGPFAVYSNAPIAADAPEIRCLRSLEADIDATLGIRVRAERPPVEVYILDDRESFTHFLRYYYPELPPRLAFFLAEGPRRVVYTYFGDRLAEDLRHEATHALLNVAVGDLPLWLDEGLAEYFEVGDGRAGRNAEHLGRLPADLAAGWKPDLARLETLRSVREMAPRDYRESWAWVHYLLNGSNAGKAALLSYLADHRTSPRAAPLSDRLRADDLGSRSKLLAHIEQTRATPAPVASASAEPTYRFQDNPIPPVRGAGPPRRGFFGRLRDLVGL